MRAEVVVQMQFANCFGPQICLSGVWQHLVATERHLWLNLSKHQEKRNKNFLMDAPIFPLTSSAMQLNRLSRDFRNQLNKQLHSRNSSAVLISPGLLSGRRNAQTTRPSFV